MPVNNRLQKKFLEEDGFSICGEIPSPNEKGNDTTLVVTEQIVVLGGAALQRCDMAGSPIWRL
jgi:hypothetical protein